MMRAMSVTGLATAIVLLSWTGVTGQGWPQWRGPKRNAVASSFQAPTAWPKELTKKWSVTVGNGVSTPAVVDGRVLVFTRQGSNEVVRCLDAASGDEIWQDEYPATAPTGGASNFPGPRSSPTVADGNVVTLGVDGALSCYGVSSGRLLWRKTDEFGGDVPMFYTASSPIVVDSLCIAQLGGGDDGGIVAFDLVSGEKRWRWTGDGPAYSSPVIMTLVGMSLVIAPTDRRLVALSTTDGGVKWEMPYAQGGRYNSATPIVSNDTLILAGPGSGFSAFKLAIDNGRLHEEKLWTNRNNSVQFNTPVLKDGRLYGISTAGQLFCINTAEPGGTVWAVSLTGPAGDGDEAGDGERAAGGNRESDSRVQLVQFVQQFPDDRPERGEGLRRGERRGEERRGEGGRRFGRGRGRRGAGYGSVVDAGAVLVALTPAAELVVFEPSESAYKEVARYKVSDGGTYAYPVLVGNDIYIKDAESLTRWAVE